ncbi:MAG: helix-turn-helix transcriptional regulator [Oscillospiraceae bacterium]|nr:helix-turn-helix transcriptional regulator [Oscillospiraceae bacterium]
MEVLLPAFSLRLKALRKEKHVTQKEMASLLEKTERHYQDIEAGRINVSATTLILLAKYFHVSTDYLLGLQEER